MTTTVKNVNVAGFQYKPEIIKMMQDDVASNNNKLQNQWFCYNDRNVVTESLLTRLSWTNTVTYHNSWAPMPIHKISYLFISYILLKVFLLNLVRQIAREWKNLFVIVREIWLYIILTNKTSHCIKYFAPWNSALFLLFFSCWYTK